MKKGFTLAELLGVIVLIAAVSLIIIPVVTKEVKNGKNSQYENQVNMIKQSLQNWTIKNYIPKNGETIYLTLTQLKDDGLVSYDIKNPLDDTYFPNDTLLEIKNINNIISYDLVLEGSNKENYLEIPRIMINGDIVTKVEKGSLYNDLGAVASFNNENITDVIVANNVDTTTVGSYHVDYNVTYNNKHNFVRRTVIVADTMAPIITFNGDLTISYANLNNYNFMSDVTVTDSSSYDIDVETNFTNLRGIYSIKYTAVDMYGNSSSKFRKVIVN